MVEVVRQRGGGHVRVRRRLAYREPFDGAGVLGFLAMRAVPGVEEVLDGGGYRRSVALPHGPGVIELWLRHGWVEAKFSLADPADRTVAEQRARALLDLDTHPEPILATLERDRVIGELVRAVPGLRVPGVVDGAELAVRAVLGQQVSVAGARTLAGRLVADYGAPLAEPVGAVTHLFPSSAALADADPARLAMPESRKRALCALTAALADGEVVLDRDADMAETRARLLALPGIGPWTVDYIAMRALRDADAFLSSDLGVRRALERLGLDGSPKAAAALAERWRPYRAYAMMHLWSVLAG
jgi:AraC family transcriptional regulator, regulatory protein of adaptative response / DNA-3-methyladenine glycosylase II